jgi:hypothetical protein
MKPTLSLSRRPALLALLGLGVMPLQAVPYVFTKIDELSSTLNGSYRSVQPTLSSESVVVYVKALDGTSNPAFGLFRFENGVTTKLIDTTNLAEFRDVGEPSISPDGQTIAFGAKDDLDTVGVFPSVSNPELHQHAVRWSGGAAGNYTQLLSSSGYPRTAGVFLDEFPLDAAVGPSAANGDKVAFIARLSELDPTPFNSKKRRIYTNFAGVQTLLVQDSTPRPLAAGGAVTPGFKLATPDFKFVGMNNQGTVCFRSLWPNLSATVTSTDTGIYTVSPGNAVQAIMERSVQYVPNTTYSFFDPMSIDDSGRVLLTSSFFFNPPGGTSRSSSGLYIKGPGLVAPIEVAPGSSFTFNRGSISPNGKNIAFRAQAFPPTGSSFTGIFTGRDAVADRVVRVGDSLFGGTVSNVDMQNKAVNNKGQIVFSYRLSSGALGIAVATPVPEPTVATVAGTMTLTWPQTPPTAPHDFKAYSSTDLAVWGAHAGTTVANGVHTLLVPRSEAHRFFRILP